MLALAGKEVCFASADVVEETEPVCWGLGGVVAARAGFMAPSLVARAGTGLHLPN